MPGQKRVSGVLSRLPAATMNRAWCNRHNGCTRREHRVLFVPIGTTARASIAHWAQPGHGLSHGIWVATFWSKVIGIRRQERMRSICVHGAHSEQFSGACRCKGRRERGVVSVVLQTHQTDCARAHDTLRAVPPQEL